MWVYSHHTCLILLSAGTIFRRQNLTSMDAKFWRLNIVLPLKGLNHVSDRQIWPRKTWQQRVTNSNLKELLFGSCPWLYNVKSEPHVSWCLVVKTHHSCIMPGKQINQIDLWHTAIYISQTWSAQQNASSVFLWFCFHDMICQLKDIIHLWENLAERLLSAGPAYHMFAQR